MHRPILAALMFAAMPALAQPEPDYNAWPVLPERFGSTGGGGFVIGEYRPVLIGRHCATAFTTTGPDGTVSRNLALFDARPVQGGVLCEAGRWAAADGSAEGTTPFIVFLGDGVRRAPTP